MGEFTGHPSMLRDGSWGACVHGEGVKKADAVMVVRRNKTWDVVKVRRVVWTGFSRYCEGPTALVELER